MTTFAWVQLAFFTAAALWTWFKVRPFMNVTMRAALRSLEISEKVALTLDEIRREAKRVDFARVEKLLEAAEKWTKPKPPAGPLEPPIVVPDGSAAPRPNEISFAMPRVFPDPTLLRFSDGSEMRAGLGTGPNAGPILGDGSVDLPPPPTLNP